MADEGGGPPVVGVDLGGTKIVVGVVDAKHQILGRAKRSTPAQKGGEAILEAILGAIGEALTEAALSVKDLAGVGVGSPGPLDPERGIILFSGNLNVENYPLGPDLERALGRPVLVRNDVWAGGYGELRLGAGRGARDLITAFVGTGIGGCVIMRGEIVAGATGNAGELGHIVLKTNGPKCGCGQRGCLEALASRTAIARRIRKAIRRGESSTLSTALRSKSDRLKSHDLAAAYHGGDALAIKEVTRAAHYLGLGLASLINVLGPEVVVVGGGVTEALGASYLDLVRASARPHILYDPDQKIRIEPAALGDDSGLLGAALMAREQFVNR
ncbi:MAG: ROK family protein [Isosphaeraceae bacterium]